jgi:hypothetical protein
LLTRSARRKTPSGDAGGAESVAFPSVIRR